MTPLHITDIELAINHWRARQPAGSDAALGAGLAELAEVYALMVYHRRDTVDEADLPAPARRLAGLVRHHARHALHRHLLHQPGRRRVQGLRPHRCGGAALAVDGPGGQARRVAPHHAAGSGLALQPLRRAGWRRGRLRFRPFGLGPRSHQHQQLLNW